MKRISTFLLFCFFVQHVFAQNDSAKVHRRLIRRTFVWSPGEPNNGHVRNEFILGPDINISGDGEFFLGAGAHLDWISIRPGQHMGHWRFCDHIFTAHWNWYIDHPYHFGIDLEYDMFRSYSGYGKQHIKFIGGVKISHLYDFTYHEIVWTPLAGFTAMGIVDLKFGYVMPMSNGNDYFSNVGIVQFDLVYRPFLVFHPMTL